MGQPYHPPPRSWLKKLAAAGAAILESFRCQASFWVHLPVAGAVVIAAAWLQVSRLEWCLLVLCIAAVFSAELMNTALEIVAQAITGEEDQHLRTGLNVASGAVLMMALGAVAVGLLIFVPHVQRLLSSAP